MTRIKFCGLKREEDILYANELLPDYIGFVFANKSRRYIDFERAEQLKNRLDTNINAVGVFVNENTENILYLLERGVIDIVQLHGNESEDYVKKIKNMTDRPIIKAFRIEDYNDAEKANDSCADYVLLDAKTPGSGECFDWNIIKNMKRDFFLAGGLSADNIKEAVAQTRPFAVDVSSGIETNGYKDIEKMREFIRNVRG